LQYDYPVHFTQDLFSRDNPVFVSALTRKEPNKRSRFVVFIDADVASSWPALAHDVRAYAESHAEQLQLLAPPEDHSGRRTGQTRPGPSDALQHRLVDLRVDRHSYVVAIGGGAFLDMVGYVAATLIAACVTSGYQPRC
jgi:3-dehydroquinate synthase